MRSDEVLKAFKEYNPLDLGNMETWAIRKLGSIDCLLLLTLGVFQILGRRNKTPQYVATDPDLLWSIHRPKTAAKRKGVGKKNEDGGKAGEAWLR
jgi:hypothetical protein